MRAQKVNERPHRESRLVDLLLLSIPKNAKRGAVGKVLALLRAHCLREEF
jgi:hypothetical protein